MSDVTRDDLRVWRIDAMTGSSGWDRVGLAEFDVIARAEGYVRAAREQTSFVSRRIWGPGDIYLAVGDEQVFDLPEGAKVRRFVTEWEVVEEADDE